MEKLYEGLAIVLIYIAVELWKYYKNRRLQAKTRMGLMISNKLALEITPILYTALMKLKASRVYILEFHNGEYYSSGRSIQKYSMTYEALYPNFDSMQRETTNRPLDAMIHTITYELSVTDYFQITNNDNLGDDRMQFKNYMKAWGIGTIFCEALRNNSGNIVGLLVYNFSKPTILSGPHRISINDTATRVQNQLNKKVN